jgi:hypothetical protein
MTLKEAEKRRLEWTFFLSADLAKEYASKLTHCGKSVVCIVEEKLEGASQTHYIVLVLPAKVPVGPLGFERNEWRAQRPERND